MRGKIFGITLVCLVIASLLPLGGFASQYQALAQGAKTWYVDDDLADYPDADFAKIQDAVDAASAGDTIVVYDGTYQEHVTLDKSVILETDEGATIDGGDTLSTVTITADRCTVSGFNVTGSGRAYENAGIWIDSNYSTISNNIISGNKRAGILLRYRHDRPRRNSITNNLVSENEGHGLYLNGDENTVEGNTISGNRGYGIYLCGEDNTLRDNVMSGNGHNFVSGYENDVDTSNTVDGKAIYFLINKQDEVIDSSSNAGYVVVVDSENITIRDLTLANNDKGVSLYACQNCVVDNITAQDNDYGISLSGCSDSAVQNCTISGNEEGLYLGNCDSIALSSNHIEDNSTGIRLRYSDASRISDNTIRTNGYGIFLRKTYGAVIEDNQVLDNDHSAIGLWSSDGNLIAGNTIQTNGKGIVFGEAYDNVIESNELLDNNYIAIGLWSSDSNLITGNTVRGSESGIYLSHSCDCRIEYNLVAQNEDNGIEIDEGYGTLIYGNTISQNGCRGIRIYDAKDNHVHHNNFIDNEHNAFSGEANSWDDGSAGNYWSDYEEKYPHAEEVDGAGIWNTPYEIPGDAGDKDNYPLMEPGVAVAINAADGICEGDNFIAQVEIFEVTNFVSANFDVTYDPGVLQVIDVTDGNIEGTEIPVTNWEFIPLGEQGTLRVINSVSGVLGISGSGYLAEIHFCAVGTACDTSELDLHDGELVDNMGREVATTWSDASVAVLARLTTSANPPEGGSVTGGGDYECGSNVSIRATPADACWEFTGWTGDGIADPTSANTTVLIDCTKMVTANFVKYQNEVIVTIDAPDEVAEGSGFVARVNISQVENFDACNYDLSYDPTVIEVTKVANGLIDGTEIPVAMWGFIPSGVPGRIRVINNVPGVPGVTGSGYLSEIHFHVVGSTGNTSDLDLHHGMLSNIRARDIPAEWIDGSVHVSEVLPGDANGDGRVNSADITKVERIVLRLDSQTPGADANRDGEVDSSDITMIERIMLQID